MEAAGLVRRVRDREDERQVRIMLTPQGSGLRAQAAKIPAALRCALDDSVGDPEMLHREIVALRDALNKAAETSVKVKS
jgi:DNA-binding MarR family transcriptional regulator